MGSTSRRIAAYRTLDVPVVIDDVDDSPDGDDLDSPDDSPDDVDSPDSADSPDDD